VSGVCRQRTKVVSCEVKNESEEKTKAKAKGGREKKNEGKKRERRVNLVDDEDVEHDVVDVDLDIGLGVDGVAETGQLTQPVELQSLLCNGERRIIANVSYQRACVRALQCGRVLESSL
jgi:hypothetical protein